MQETDGRGGRIEIRGLRLQTRVGVTDGERAIPQEVRVDLYFAPARGLFDLNDDLGSTIDYSAMADVAREVAASGERRLIETLAEEILEAVLRSFLVEETEVTVHKYALPGTDSVGVRLWRRADNLGGSLKSAAGRPPGPAGEED
jgi:dihydroneopterin aldolase